MRDQEKISVLFNLCVQGFIIITASGTVEIMVKKSDLKKAPEFKKFLEEMSAFPNNRRDAKTYKIYADSGASFKEYGIISALDTLRRQGIGVKELSQ